MQRHLHLIALFAVTILVSLLVGSTLYYYSPLYHPILSAVAVITPTKGNSASGVFSFEQKADGLNITGRMSGLKPGAHGIHVHEFGNCACDDAVCAGSHFNPTAQPHGGPDDKQRHVGDFGNIVADKDGNAVYEYVDKHARLNGPHSIIGRALIVHADPDDGVSQPAGNSGARIAVGVIGVAAKAQPGSKLKS